MRDRNAIYVEAVKLLDEQARLIAKLKECEGRLRVLQREAADADGQIVPMRPEQLRRAAEEAIHGNC